MGQMTLLDAKQYDPKKDRRKRARIILTVVVIVIVAALVWWFRYWPEEHIVGKFFDALQKQDYNTAYAIWMHDPEWQKHPQQYQKYPFGDFYRDWGPGGEWGTIKTEKVYGASSCPGGGSGIVVDVVVNDRAEHAQVWVEKSDHTLSYPPCELVFR
jgi:hypothetical protein